ncbi:PilZ domain-containing protein [Candidatus Thiodictyon syntrophicum]|jgi:hypothetical protein|uniref:PilZ domain-containing protein n=1 Tax=Candidatus Thiodictyon syntrophicum TaxID=1166950 RepID=A0A2K8U428_9GAMM|nr:PilZ domain-containing protein [Candidatus Thiodictyon syntrophicum]AUB80332.1 hypothetical protein THSYN_04770 [Candidatus Thiodictyon syntrophicum]
MMAERHDPVRHPIDIEVQILYHGRRFFTARGRSLSTQGMYLNVRNLTLPVGTRVELEMECVGKPWRLEAAVVHRSPAGVGVKFREVQPELDLGLDRALDAMLTQLEPLMSPPPTLGRAAAATAPALARLHD